MFAKSAVHTLQMAPFLRNNFALFLSGKSVIRLAVSMTSQEEYSNTRIKEASPYISNHQDFFDPAEISNTKIVSTRFEVDLNKLNLEQDLSKILDKRSIFQINENRTMATATPSLSRFIGISALKENLKTSREHADPYLNVKKNMETCEKLIQENVGSPVAWMIHRDNYRQVQENELFKKKYKAMDFNIIEYSNSEKVLMDEIHNNSYKLEHIFLRSYRQENAKYVEDLDFLKNQINLNELFQILRLNSFRGVLVLPFTDQYFLRNLIHIKSLLHASGLYTEREDAEINDNWRVL